MKIINGFILATLSIEDNRCYSQSSGKTVICIEQICAAMKINGDFVFHMSSHLCVRVLNDENWTMEQLLTEIDVA